MTKSSLHSQHKSATGKIRIIGGEWRGRKLSVLDKQGLRPTSDRVRETLFNWLNFRVPASRCLDLFAGTGALGFEAASRGAQSVVLVERDRDIAQNLVQQVAILQATQLLVVHQDALSFLEKTPTTPFNIIFLDPPFSSDFLTPCLQKLAQGWLAPHALLYIEQAREAVLPVLPATSILLKQLTTAQVRASLVQL
ncbi:RNA methyltransferase, RsmD family [Beggiatoa alba B18LD]|uniref:Ribosomal RNA small subunit methyltransferase D n=1 Tax=Beggiatoa alba B18LD TaxID=395493 RepID=I3CCH5_9GAMM|nr:16S rRNA (guanine(966)-N(2))-methyltransferase RsmD [Beggiatoa alba]EIJ41318.1 RNA methyltransferase, RsmD family [Beggiatoa alba B18LD]